MVWGAISSVAKGPLVIFVYKEKVIAQVYSYKILPYVSYFIKEVKRYVDFMRSI
jgi:hypothetical protein